MDKEQIADALDAAADIAAYYAEAGEDAGGAGGTAAREDEDTLRRWAKHFREDLSQL